MLDKTFKEYIYDRFAGQHPEGCYETIMENQYHFLTYYGQYQSDGGTEVVTFTGQPTKPVKQRRILNAA